MTAEGKLLTASAEDHGDLFWALRGGGNFGVVTSFEYHPVSTILGGMIVYPRNQATEVLRFCRTFTQSAPEELTAYAGLLHTPDGMPAVAVVACYCGDLAEGERVLSPLREFGSPLLDAMQPMPFPQMQSLLDGAFPGGNRNYWKSDVSARAQRRRNRPPRRACKPGDLAANGRSDRVLRRSSKPWPKLDPLNEPFRPVGRGNLSVLGRPEDRLEFLGGMLEEMADLVLTAHDRVEDALRFVDAFELGLSTAPNHWKPLARHDQLRATREADEESIEVRK